MKLIINIPDELYNQLREDHSYNSAKIAYRELMNGIPYEERPQGDLISRDALIKWIDDSVSKYGHIYSTDTLNMWGLFKDYLINFAPTVEPEPVSERQKRALAIVDALTEKRLINVMERGCLRRSIILEPERPQGEWVLVGEGLPERFKEVIVTDIETKETYCSWYHGNGYWECDNGVLKNRIIAWQPLPKPYKAGGKEE